MNVQRLECDVLVIGGGAAGARAAHDAAVRGLRTILLCKAEVGRSGCSIFAGTLNAPPEAQGRVLDEDGPDMAAIGFLTVYTQFLGDQEYFRDVADYTNREFYPWYEERGLYVLRDESGAIVTDQPKRLLVNAPKMGMSGTTIMDMMRKLLPRVGVEVRNRTAATTLLTADGRCVGAVAYDYRSSTLLVVSAPAVVLATGHSNFLSLRATGTREGAGSGWVLAYEAGAQLRNIEMQWYHAADVAHPAAWMRLHLYPNPLPGTEHRARLVNSDGETFFDGNWFADDPVPYLLQLKRLYREVQAGRARFDGGYYSSYEHVEPEVLRDFFYQSAFIKKLGSDLSQARVENAISYHMNVGGVSCDAKTMASNVPGLLVAGSVGALVTGGLPRVTYDGIVAARSAGELVAEARGRAPSLDESAVEREIARVRGLAESGGADGLAPSQVKHQIRQIMWEDMNYVKNEACMLRAADRLRELRETVLPRMAVTASHSPWSYGVVEALDAWDMVRACELQVAFSRYRQESRGAFYREDYPVTDNVSWLRHVVGTRDEDGTPALSTEPVDLPYMRPEEDVVDFFEARY